MGIAEKVVLMLSRCKSVSADSAAPRQHVAAGHVLQFPRKWNCRESRYDHFWLQFCRRYALPDLGIVHSLTDINIDR